MGYEQQSPINVLETIPSTLTSEVLQIRWSDATQGFISPEQGHGLKVVFPPDPESVVVVSGKTYPLKEFHFHHPAEHLLGGKQFPFEVHIVHQNLEDASYAVLAVFLDHNGSERSSRPASRDPVKAEGSGRPISTDPYDWLPRDRTHLYRYEGSLTTAPFSERVSWVVFRQPRVARPGETDFILESHPLSARDVQPINRRYVIEYTGGRKRAK